MAALAPPAISATAAEGGSEIDRHAEVIPYIVPSHTLPKNDGDGIGKSIRKHRPASRQRLLNASNSKILLEVRESDAASANITYVHRMNLNALSVNAQREQTGCHILAVHQLCLIHQLYLVVAELCKLLGEPTITIPNLLYCVSRVLRSAGYWETLIATVPVAVKVCLVIKTTGWTPDCKITRKYNELS